MVMQTTIISLLVIITAGAYGRDGMFRYYKGQRYIEVAPNTALELPCSVSNNSIRTVSNLANDVRWRDCERELDEGNVLHLTVGDEADTGLYSCLSDETTLLSAAHIYVSESTRDNQVFVHMKRTELIPNGHYVLVPCRTNRMVDGDQVRLHIERQWLKDTVYDPRFGFTLERNALENLKTTHFRCSYHEYISQEFVLHSIDGQYPIISATEWPVLHDRLEIDCQIKNLQTEDWQFEWNFPRANSSDVLVAVRNHRTPPDGTTDTGTLWSRMTILETSQHDSGLYECTLHHKHSKESFTSTISVDIGIRIGQVKGYSASYDRLYGDVLTVTRFFDPHYAEHEYWRKWMKSVNGSEPAEISEKEKKLIAFSEENGVHKEQLGINVSQIAPGTSYRLEIHVPWFVAIVSMDMDRMLVLKVVRDSEEVDGYLDPLQNLSVVCSAVALTEHGSPVISVKRDDNAEWEQVEGFLIESNRTTVWNTQFTHDTLVRCSRGGAQVERRLKVVPWMETSLYVVGKKMDSAPMNVHKHDTVVLKCSVFMRQSTDVTWIKDWTGTLNWTNEVVVKDIRNVFVRITNVNEEDEGRYRCSASSDGRPIIYSDILLKLDDQPSSGTELLRGVNCVSSNVTSPSYSWRRGKRLLCVRQAGRTKHYARNTNDTFNCSPQRTVKSKRQPESTSSSIHYLLTVVALAGGVLIILLAATFIYARGRDSELKRLKQLHALLVENSHSKAVLLNDSLPLHQQVEQLPYDASIEIKLDRLVTTKVLSSGEYGRVYAGELRSKHSSGHKMEVAVKGPRDAAKYEHMKALVDELRIMNAIGDHPNVLGLVGAVTKNMRKGGDLYIIVELCKSDLKSFLIKNRNAFVNALFENAQHGGGDYLIPQRASVDNPENDCDERDKHSTGYVSLSKSRNDAVTTCDLISFAYQVANGMNFLAKKKCLHRDLAARNVLLTSNRVVRIADFGLARQCDHLYHVQSFQLPLPYKSMAPESIREFQFTEKSDVWSYGILLWEIFTMGKDPYKDIKNIESLLALHESGERLDEPDIMPESISALMNECWQRQPGGRPNFSTCKKITEYILRDSNPQLHGSVQNLLNQDLNGMHRYVEWRDGKVERH